VIEVSLDKVMKIDAIIWSLQEALMKTERNTNGTNNKNGIIKVCENNSDESQKISELNGKVNLIKYVDETSNNEELNRSEKIRNPAWLSSSKHQLNKMHGITMIVGRK
ncbi:41359_t:CDS:2, partial [Gigaspora margarita]